MADKTGRPATALAAKKRAARAGSPSVLEELLRKPRNFSFLQAVRLLKQAHSTPGSEDGREFLRRRLRVRPYLSLGFPPTDIAEIKELPRDEDGGQAGRRFQITATFLGLYGPSSPLPTFYTEELLEEQSDDKSVSRDFLDIINHGFFTLFVLADTHYNLSRQVCEENNREVLERLFALVGLGHREMLQESFSHPGALLRATGLLTQFPRSAAGLRGLLTDRIGAPVEIRQWEPRQAVIPEDQRCCLGREGHGILGENSWLGSRAVDAMGKITVVVGPVSADTFARLLPGTPKHDELLALVRFYCTQPLEFDLEVVLAEDEVQPGCLGSESWSQLGCDVWLGPASSGRTRALFPERRRIWDQNQQRSMAQ